MVRKAQTRSTIFAGADGDVGIGTGAATYTTFGGCWGRPEGGVVDRLRIPLLSAWGLDLGPGDTSGRGRFLRGYRRGRPGRYSGYCPLPGCAPGVTARWALHMIIVSESSAEATGPVRTGRSTTVCSGSSVVRNDTPRYTNARPISVHTEVLAGIAAISDVQSGRRSDIDRNSTIMNSLFTHPKQDLPSGSMRGSGASALATVASSPREWLPRHVCYSL
jgi:hypothetical protein